MISCEPCARTTLKRCASLLTQSGLREFLLGATRDMWRINADRYEPSHLHDTPRGIAGMAIENLRERLLAKFRHDVGSWQAPCVRLSVPHGSLLIEVAEYRLHLLKAQGFALREPVWSAFDWDSSATRAAAADANGRSASGTGEGACVPGQLTLDDLTTEADRFKGRLREALVVWAGDLEGRTAGWVGSPSSGQQRWLAVQSLWRDDVRMSAEIETAPSPAGQAFHEREAPQPMVALNRHERRGEL